jgi:hypothetical protein
MKSVAVTKMKNIDTAGTLIAFSLANVSNGKPERQTRVNQNRILRTERSSFFGIR